MRSKDIKDLAHNESLVLLDKLIHDLDFKYPDIRMFAEHLRHELLENRNRILVRKGLKLKKEKIR